MRAIVTVDRLDPPDQIIRLSVEQTDPREAFTTLRGDLAGASGYLSAREAYQLALDLLDAAARVGLRVTTD